MTRIVLFFAVAAVALAFHPAAFADDIGGGKPESSEATISAASWFDGFWSTAEEPSSDDSGE